MLKVWGHPKNSAAVPSRVGMDTMEECFLDLIFLLVTARPFGFLGGVGAAVFFPIDETRFSKIK